MKTHIRWALCGSIGNSIGFLISLLFLSFNLALVNFLFWELIWIFTYVLGDLYLGLNKDVSQEKTE